MFSRTGNDFCDHLIIDFDEALDIALEEEGGCKSVVMGGTDFISAILATLEVWPHVPLPATWRKMDKMMSKVTMQDIGPESEEKGLYFELPLSDECVITMISGTEIVVKVPIQQFVMWALEALATKPELHFEEKSKEETIAFKKLWAKTIDLIKTNRGCVPKREAPQVQENQRLSLVPSA
ncbi:MAG: hypothetical protein IT410_01305 [Candidatus Doudnabacteria bacterium]|nr:hypothetical protein [Candidatus Doudnabacteria bacterium]